MVLPFLPAGSAFAKRLRIRNPIGGSIERAGSGDTIAGTAHNYTLSVNAGTVWYTLHNGTADVLSRISSTISGTVQMTAPAAGTYRPRLYDAESGGNLIWEGQAVLVLSSALGVTITSIPSPQLPSVVIPVSGTYAGAANPTITLQWYDSVGTPVGASTTAGTVLNGQWSGQVTSPATPGLNYFLRASHNAVSADAINVEISEAGVQVIMDFGITGSNAPSGTVLLCGIAFPPGVVFPHNTVGFRRKDDGTYIACQIDPWHLHSDGSIAFAGWAVRCPTLANGAQLLGEIVVGETHGNPGAIVDLAAALAGREVETTVNYSGGSPWTLTASSNLPATSAYRRRGPLVSEARVEAAVPSSACGVESLRIVMDVYACSDGTVWCDSIFRNADTHVVGGGIAECDIDVTIGGTTVRSISEGVAGNVLYQYGSAARLHGRSADNTAPTPPTPIYDVKYHSENGLWFSFDATNPTTSTRITEANNIMNSAQFNDLYYNAGIVRSWGAAGGRPDLTYDDMFGALFFAQSTPLFWHTIQRRGEAITSNFFHMRSPTTGTWLTPGTHPRFALLGGLSSPAGTADIDVLGLPTDQPMNSAASGTYWGIDQTGQHTPQVMGIAYFLTGRASFEDSLAAIAAFGFLGNNLRFDVGVASWRGAVDYATGVGVAHKMPNSSGRDVGRSLANSVWAAGLLSDNYPNRAFIADTVTASVRAWKYYFSDLTPQNWRQIAGETYGSIQTNVYNAHTAMWTTNQWRTDLMAYAVARALWCHVDVDEDAAQDCLEFMLNFRTGQALANPAEYMPTAIGLLSSAQGTNNPLTVVNTWAGLAAINDVYRPMNRDWTPAGPDPTVGQVFGVDGEYIRRCFALLGLAYRVLTDERMRLRCYQAYMWFWSEREIGQAVNTNPSISAHPEQNYMGRDPADTHLLPGTSFVLSGLPAIRDQTISRTWGADESLTFPQAIQEILTDGVLPKATARGLNDMIEITSGDAVFVMDRGVLTMTAIPSSLSGSITFRARLGDSVGATKAINYTLSVAAPTAIANETPWSVPENSDVGTVVGTLTLTGTGPLTAEITAGNAGGLFAITGTGYTRNVEVASSLVGADDTTLTIEIVGPGGTTTVNPSITISAAVNAPEVGDQTLSITEGVAVGTNASPTLVNTGGTITGIIINSGDSANRWEGAAPNIIRTAGRIARVEEDQYVLGITASNQAGSDNANITINVGDATYPWIYNGANTRPLGVFSISRRLRSNYTGNICRLYKNSDGSDANPLDITGATNADFSALAAFAAGSRVYVAPYDQSPLEQGLLVAAPSGLPYLTDASGGQLFIGANNRPTAYFESGRGWRHTAFNSAGQSDLSVMLVAARRFSSGTVKRFLVGISTDGSSSPTSGNTSLGLRSNSTSSLELYRNNSLVSSPTNSFANDITEVLGALTLGNVSNRYRTISYGATVTGASTSTWTTLASTFHFTVGYRTNVTANDYEGWFGEIGEIVVFGPVELTSDHVNIRSNMETYFGV